LKRCWGVAQPERHDAELEEPQRVLNHLAPANASSVSSMRGMG
ncbi:hypothetical protein T09_3071, partial [Trichinella sp. T9]